MIGRRLPASSSFVLAAARLRALQLDPGRATAQTGSHEEKPQHSPPQTPAAKAQVTGSDHHTLLTAKAPMGANTDFGGLAGRPAPTDQKVGGSSPSERATRSPCQQRCRSGSAPLTSG